jgi:hypothetical protein
LVHRTNQGRETALTSPALLQHAVLSDAFLHAHQRRINEWISLAAFVNYANTRKCRKVTSNTKQVCCVATSIETLEKMARALEVPLYAILYERKGEAQTSEEKNDLNDWASHGKGAREFRKFRQSVAAMSAQDRNTFMFMAEKVARGRKK